MMEFTSKNPHFKSSVLNKMQQNHFMQHLGIRINALEAGFVEGELSLQTIHLQQAGAVHGGVSSTMADIVMGFAALSLASEEEGMVTSDLKIAYLRPGFGHSLIGRGRVIKAGNLLYYCEADIICLHADHGETLIARGYATMCTVRKNHEKPMK